MKQQPNILVVGFGSAGRRHYRNLVSLGYRKVSVFDVDRKTLSGIPRAFSSWNGVQLSDFDVVFVCSPNHLHMRHAFPAAKAGCHLFIEKPLSHELPLARRLAALCERKKLVTMVGCNMRFHPCLAFTKKYLAAGRLGAVYGIHHEFGHWLPLWRKKTDYRKTYAALRREGGGIILDDLHEFDLMFWLNDFEKVRESKFLFARSGKFEIETEDNCVAAFKFENGTLGSVRCDYLQQRYSRTCKVVGEKGNLFWDFNENIVWLERAYGRERLFIARKYNLNSMYMNEIAYFLDCVTAQKPTQNEVGRAVTVLRYCVERR